MKRNEEAMLRILRCAVHGEATPDPVFSAEEWAALLRLSEAHGLLPLVYDAAYRCASFQQLEPETRKAFQTRAIRRAISQIRQSSEFLTLLLHAQAQGLDPIVLKGITVRSLYPRPMLRPSVDEDLLVRPGEAAAYHRFFLSEGLVPDDPEAELSTAAELSYHRPESPTYIELHLHPFPPESEAYGDCNALFAGASERAVRVQIEDVALRALAPTEHLLYLLCHAYKHFLHSGVGIRQVCDIGMFAQRYGEEIDWSRVLAGCAEIRIEHLAAALFRKGSWALPCRRRLRHSPRTRSRCWRTSLRAGFTARRTRTGCTAGRSRWTPWRPNGREEDARA